MFMLRFNSTLYCCAHVRGNHNILYSHIDNIVYIKVCTQNVHRPGIEPGSPAWQASILPLNHRCFVLWMHQRR